MSVEFIAPVTIYPGQDEMKALTENALAVAPRRASGHGLRMRPPTTKTTSRSKRKILSRGWGSQTVAPPLCFCSEARDKARGEPLHLLTVLPLL